MLKRAVILSLLLLSFTGEVLIGQNADKGFLMGRVFTQGIGERSSPDGAAIMLITRQDTLYTVVVNGTFLFENLPLGPARLSLSHLTYEIAGKKELEIEIKPRTLVEISTVEKVMPLDMITVEGQVPLISMSGDTLRFNAAAVKLLEGDLALEILRQVPGVEISDSGIKVLGQNVRRTYINSRMIFGTNTMTALSYIPADEVVSINTYEEYENKDSLSRREGDQRVRVLDIRTKSPMITAVTGHALISYGRDLEPQERNRYGAGITSNFFSEPLLLSCNVFTNNTGRQSNRMSELASTYSPPVGYTEQTYVDVGAEKMWGEMFQDNMRLIVAYTFDRRNIQNDIIQQDVYLPSPEYAVREYADTLRSGNLTRSHKAILNFSGIRRSLGSINFNSELIRTDNSSDTYRGMANRLDDQEILSKSHDGMKDSGYSLRSDLNVSNSTHNKIYSKITLSYNRSDNDGRGFRIDSLASTGIRNIIVSGPIGKANRIGVGASVEFKLSETMSRNLTFSYGLEYNDRYSRRYATDITCPGDPQTDIVNTYDYTQDYIKHTAGMRTYYAFNDDTRIDITTNIETWRQNREERFPDVRDNANAQKALLPQIQFQSRISALGMLTFDYHTSTIVPSTEQYRYYLDNRNPYRMVAGNPNLKQSYVHTVELFYYLHGKHNTYTGIRLGGTFTRNAIADKTTFFTERTDLPQWNTVAEAQSTLTEFVNLDGNATASLAVNYNWQQKDINSRISVGLGIDYKNISSYLGEEFNRNRYYASRLNLMLNSNFSRNLRIAIGGGGVYIFSENTAGQEDKAIKSDISARAEWNPHQYLFVKGSYTMAAYHSLNGGFTNTSAHVLNAVVGCRLFKGNIEVGLAVYDILNNNKGFTTSMIDNYIHNLWRKSFGRYFMINFGYKLFKSTSGLTQPKGSRLNDGDIRR
ncbi:MAG: outer membrane beta-barrel protein [Bacteroidales bacterium]|nr:outer membrane beta-barrel protein [Bacteroidales bacterium]MDD3989742.1 outer membrane beta-barrel protein [Bacteroidales bacterium]